MQGEIDKVQIKPQSQHHQQTKSFGATHNIKDHVAHTPTIGMASLVLGQQCKITCKSTKDKVNNIYPCFLLPSLFVSKEIIDCDLLRKSNCSSNESGQHIENYKHMVQIKILSFNLEHLQRFCSHNLIFKWLP
jgi:hypothetical protein